MADSWKQVLDSMTCQVDLQEKAIRYGQQAPVDLEVDEPVEPLGPMERLRAIELFERCEHLLDMATARAVESRAKSRSPYGSRS